MKNVILKAAAIAALASTAQPALACGIEPMVGEICYFSFNFCPKNYVAANGAQMNISQNSALYSLVGQTFGPSSNTNTYFLLPDLQGRMAVNNGQGTSTSAIRLGQKGGQEKVSLYSGNLPSGAGATISVTPAADASSAAKTGKVAVTGASTPISTRSPYLGVTVCIATNGSYPSRPD